MISIIKKKIIITSELLSKEGKSFQIIANIPNEEKVLAPKHWADATIEKLSITKHILEIMRDTKVKKKIYDRY